MILTSYSSVRDCNWKGQTTGGH